MTAESVSTPDRRSRGDRQREAIVAAVRDLLQHHSFADLSVSTISEKAGVARSGFYFYFDSKYDVLAYMFKDALAELDELTGDFAPRDSDETPRAFAKRMVGSAAIMVAHNDPIMAASTVAKHTDGRIREVMSNLEDAVVGKIVAIVAQDADARPISDDVPTLVRMLCAMTTMTLSRDEAFVGRRDDPNQAIAVMEALWLNALWGGGHV